MARSKSTSGETLTARIYGRLRNDVLRGSLPPRQKLKIDELSRAYGAGSSPIREALNLLTSDGLVERLDQRGFRVRDVSAADFDDVLQMRCWLEERALRESIERGGTDWDEAIVLSFFRLNRAAAEAGNATRPPTPGWEALHKQFHLSLIAACSSPILYRYCDQLYDQNIRYRYIARIAADPGRNIKAEHEGIVEAVLARDAAEATRRIISHYTLTGEYLRRTLFPATATVAGGQMQESAACGMSQSDS